MEDIIFGGCAKIESYDFIESEKRLASRGAGGLTTVLITIFGAFFTALGGLHLLLSTVATSLDKQGSSLILVLLGAVNLITAYSIRNSGGKLRIKAPINRDRHACIELYENRISYHDEFVKLNASYDDVECLINGKSVFVFTFSGADPIVVPKTCFGWDNYKKAETFLKEKLRGKVRG